MTRKDKSSFLKSVFSHHTPDRVKPLTQVLRLGTALGKPAVSWDDRTIGEALLLFHGPHPVLKLNQSVADGSTVFTDTWQGGGGEQERA